MTRNKMIGVVALTGLLMSATAAHAYVLPAEALMDRAVAARLRLKMTGLVMRGSHEKDGTRSQVWQAIRPGARRLELRRGEDTNVVLDRGRERYAFSPGTGPVRPSRGPTDLLAELGFPQEPDKSGIRGIDMLKKLGIDTSVVSFGRQNRRIVFVIGAKANDLGKPQLWLDKELMVPVRLIRFDRQRARIDTRWLGFASPLTAPYHPRRIETWVNGELSEAITYTDIDVNPKLNDALFEPPR